MLQTIEVEIDEMGRIEPVEPIGKLPVGRALLTLLAPVAEDVSFFSELALATDWLRPEENEAWADLRPDK